MKKIELSACWLKLVLIKLGFQAKTMSKFICN